MALAFDFSTPWALYAAWAVLFGVVYVVCYRRYFHPLAKIPGPFLPAVTQLCVWYHNVIKHGTFFRRIDDMHDQYGPVVRIAPNEVHLIDPDNYDKIYTVGSKFDKDPVFHYGLEAEAMFTALTSEEHRRRRGPLNQFFSRRAILDLEDIVQEKVTKFCRIVQESFDAGKPVNLQTGARAISVDVLTEYAFDDCWNHLDAEDFGAWLSEAVQTTIAMWFNFQQFPFLMPIMQLIPEDFARKMSPAMNNFIDCVTRAREYVMKVREQFLAGIKPKRQTIFHELLDSPDTDVGKSDLPSLNRLFDEAFGLCTAAADTTGNAIEMTTYYVVTAPDIYSKLTKELSDAFPDPNARLDYLMLEKLPYLTAVIKEGLRLSYGTLTRLPRVVPAGGATFNGIYLPAGTVVSMSSWDMHRHPDAFPSPDVFDPTRWMDADPAVLRAREKCLVPFSRGSRSCIGQNLALCEVYVTLGTMFRRFDNLAPFDVGPEDMTYRDLFQAFHPQGARPFKIMAKGKK